MPQTSVKINYAQIRAKLDKTLTTSNRVRIKAYDKAYGIYYRAKSAMLIEFDRHLVTNEILEGPKAANISGTLDGYGNLFSFIGFNEGSDPIEPLREVLAEGITFKQTVYRNKKWYFRVTWPSSEVIESVTSMPWEIGNSWAEGIEKGISGLSNYMNKKWGNGRSGNGFQLPYPNQEEINFIPIPYLSEILSHFRERINNIK